MPELLLSLVAVLAVDHGLVANPRPTEIRSIQSSLMAVLAVKHGLVAIPRPTNIRSIQNSLMPILDQRKYIGKCPGAQGIFLR